jgi:chemotaxis-related protein WspB
MLMLLIYIGNERFAFGCDQVIEVIPRVHLKKIAHTPSYVAGMLNFRGVPVPVIDLCMLLEDRPCIDRLHSRIILLKYPGEAGTHSMLGLMAERVTQSVHHESKEFIDSGIRTKEAPFLDGVLTDKDGIIQMILLNQLFEMVRGVLFAK